MHRYMLVSRLDCVGVKIVLALARRPALDPLDSATTSRLVSTMLCLLVLDKLAFFQRHLSSPFLVSGMQAFISL
jgi:hypothetical protein